jgi:uncharacterized protein (TIGR02246 family)
MAVDLSAQLLNDEREIRNLIASMAQRADSAELDDYLALFTADAVWETSADRRVGIDDIRAGVIQRRGAGIQGPGTHTRHVNTTLRVDVDGSDTASAESVYLFLRDTGSAPTIARAGSYLDTFRREADGWKFAHRIITDG